MTTIFRWHHDSRWRLVAAVACGIIVAVIVAIVLDPAYSPLLGWTTTGILYSSITWLSIGRMTASETAEHATREAPGGWAVHILLTVAAIASLAGIAILIIRPPNSQVAAASVALLVIIASWMTVQTINALRYAREYYRTGTGVDFHTSDPPCYIDFAYMAFTVGMSFAISDTDLQSTSMRRIALWHALLAYLFGTIFVAGLVNILVGLGG